MKSDFKEEYYFPDPTRVNNSHLHHIAYPSEAMIICFEQLTKAIHNVAIQAERIADILGANEDAKVKE